MFLNDGQQVAEVVDKEILDVMCPIHTDDLLLFLRTDLDSSSRVSVWSLGLREGAATAAAAIV